MGKLNSTRVIRNNNNPIFFETLQIGEIECYVGLDDMPPFILDIYDKDSILKDDYLGRAVIPVNECACSESYENPATPKWHQIKFS